MIYHNIYDLSDNKNYSIKSELKQIGVSKEVIDYLNDKFTYKRFYIKDIDFRAANILKQEALSVGADAAISYKTYTMDPQKTDILLCGTMVQLNKISEKLLKQPFKLKELGLDLNLLINGRDFETLKIGNIEINPDDNRCYIMGIINITPDSFYSDSRVNLKNLEKKIIEFIKYNVDIIDIGGESTRPGSEQVSEEEEIKRVIPAIKLIRKITDKPISIDTYKSNVARLAIEEGADLVNDISALTMDENMVKLIAETKRPVILMHMKGQPKTMQQNPSYDNLIDEIYLFFKERIKFCQEYGIDEKNIIIDPGIGFGKRYKDNLVLTKYLSAFKTLRKPILYAASRKSFIGKALSNNQDPVAPEERLYGSLAVHILASKIAKIIRVHDIKQTYEMEILRQKVEEVDRFECN